MFQTKVVEKIKTKFLNTPFSQNCAIYEMIIWRMRIACWMPKAKNILSEYVTLTAFPLQQWLHEPASALGYMHIVGLVQS